MTTRTRWALLLTLTAVLAGCTTGASTAPDAAQATVLRVGQIQKNLQPLLEAAGQLDNLGYTISWSSFPAGPPVIEAENAGSIDLAYTADTPPIFAQAARIGVHVVAITRPPAGAQNIALLVRGDSPVHSVADLQGKRVAIVPGTITQYLLVEALKEAGVSYRDVTPVNLQGPDAISALQRGDADAIVVVDPLQAAAIVAGARVLRSGAGLIAGSNALVAADKALGDQRRAAAIGDLLKRIKTAITWAAKNQAAWTSVYARINQLPPQAARDAVRRAATEVVPIDATAFETQQHQADAFLALGLLPARLKVEDQYDTRYNTLLFPGASQR